MDSSVHKLLDIELTNRCNALCFFCPRDKTPHQGFITDEHFYKAVERATELEHRPNLSLTGQGEPTMHPQIVSYIQHAKQLGFFVMTTSNASLLNESLAEKLIDSGLDRICFSVSDLEDTYEQVYNLDFAKTLENIDRFIALNQGRVEVVVNVVEHELNSHKLREIKQFWRARGVDSISQMTQSNRGGACDNGHQFLGNDNLQEQTVQVMRENGLSSLCPAAFVFLFVGWDGNYYICCNDYEKTSPLGHVLEHSINDINDIKLKALAKGIPACVNCNIEPSNVIREKLLDIENGFADQDDLNKEIARLQKQQTKLPPLFSDVDWKLHYTPEELIAKA